ncbi:MAG: hypothetical protein KME46_32280 [Brasilonema angustatum HA4187-MV1]|jgi:hypothetical protein|nr:hypothetical protein [Brasilonema angustatum HA4187-MV1]
MKYTSSLEWALQCPTPDAHGGKTPHATLREAALRASKPVKPVQRSGSPPAALVPYLT